MKQISWWVLNLIKLKAQKSSSPLSILHFRGSMKSSSCSGTAARLFSVYYRNSETLLVLDSFCYCFIMKTCCRAFWAPTLKSAVFLHWESLHFLLLAFYKCVDYTLLRRSFKYNLVRSVILRIGQVNRWYKRHVEILRIQ